MTILWISKHPPTPRQRWALGQAFPSETVLINHNRQTFSGARDIISRFRASGAQEMVVVAPMHVIRHIVKLGVQPLWAEMQPCPPGDLRAEVHIHGRHYRFVKFWRVLGLDFNLADIRPSLTKPKSTLTNFNSTLV